MTTLTSDFTLPETVAERLRAVLARHAFEPVRDADALRLAVDAELAEVLAAAQARGEIVLPPGVSVTVELADQPGSGPLTIALQVRRRTDEPAR